MGLTATGALVPLSVPLCASVDHRDYRFEEFFLRLLRRDFSDCSAMGEGFGGTEHGAKAGR
ncbi:hypothetical protein HP532_25635 [Pseudomonas sp. CrR25]|nr:hypothetical protein [Pseudomonas sp. CrR25]